MTTSEELKNRYWAALRSDMTMMRGLDGVEDGHARPMTAQVEGDRGLICRWLSLCVARCPRRLAASIVGTKQPVRC